MGRRPRKPQPDDLERRVLAHIRSLEVHVERFVLTRAAQPVKNGLPNPGLDKRVEEISHDLQKLLAKIASDGGGMYAQLQTRIEEALAALRSRPAGRVWLARHQPLHASNSVETTSGGLPGLGKRT